VKKYKEKANRGRNEVIFQPGCI